jgi:UDPglucose 6-dehydrogenase
MARAEPLGVGGPGVKVCVLGLWHLGSVTAACLASVGHHVTGLDSDSQFVEKLQTAVPPVSEPGLVDLIRDGIKSGKLRFTNDVKLAVSSAQVLWVTYDTPIDENDQADVAFVFQEVVKLLPFVSIDAIVLVSSQLPVGSIKRFEDISAEKYPEKNIRFAYSPENLRLGKSLDVFLRPDRVIIGVRRQEDREILGRLLGPITDNILWMSVESAEMTKHAINAFLGMSITFINEIASICENMGADAREVETGLKSETRIGPAAYLSPGAAFAGGTLARDIEFLKDIGSSNNLVNPLISAVRKSNDEHKKWIQRRLVAVLGDLKGKRIAVWGLTYKPGTNTLRRSPSVEMCNWLRDKGVEISVHDPSECDLPDNWLGEVVRSETPLEALEGACALVIATQWPEYREINVSDVENIAGQLAVFDSNRFLSGFNKSS